MGLFMVKNSSQLSTRFYCWENYSDENKVQVFAALLSTADISPLSALEVVAHIMYKEECVNTHVLRSS